MNLKDKLVKKLVMSMYLDDENEYEFKRERKFKLIIDLATIVVYFVMFFIFYSLR